jgi:hypothetical protein
VSLLSRAELERRLIARIEDYEAIRHIADAETERQCRHLAWFLRYVWRDTHYDYNGIRYRAITASDLERDPKYRKPEYGWRRSHKVAA